MLHALATLVLLIFWTASLLADPIVTTSGGGDPIGTLSKCGAVAGKIPKTDASGIYQCSDDAGAATGAPTTSTFITQTPDGTLSAEQALSSLATCLLRNTTGTGVLACYTGTTPVANTFLRSVDSQGSGTTSAVQTADIAAGAINNAQVNTAAAIAESKLALTFPTHTNANDPSAGEKSALAGTSGTPSGANAYVTNADARNTNARTPVAPTASTLGGVFAKSCPTPPDKMIGLDTAGNPLCSPDQSAGGAPITATYLTQTPDATLSNEQSLSTLATCLLRNTTGTGVLACYTGSGAVANQFLRSTDGQGVGTHSQVQTADIASGAILNAQVGAGAAIVESKLALNFATHTNANDPTAGEKSALAGTSGAPGAANAYVTNADPRNTNARTPVAPTAVALGGVFAKSCTTPPDKMIGIDTSGNPICASDLNSGTGGGAPTTATYITQTPDAGLDAEQALSALGTCLLANTTGTGVLSCYGGTTPVANTFLRSVNAQGVGTTSAVQTADIASGAILNTQVGAAAGIVESKLALNFPTHSNANDPTAGQKAALAGSVGTPSGTNLYVTQQGLDAHLTDTTDAHMAASIGFTPTGAIAATQTQAAVAEVATDAAAALTTHEADTSNVHGIVDTTALVLTSDVRLPSADTPAGLSAASQINCNKPTQLITSTTSITLTDPKWLTDGDYVGQVCRPRVTHATNTITGPTTATIKNCGGAGSVVMGRAAESPDYTWDGTLWTRDGCASLQQNAPPGFRNIDGATNAATAFAAGDITGGTYCRLYNNTLECFQAGSPSDHILMCGGSECERLTQAGVQTYSGVGRPRGTIWWDAAAIKPDGTNCVAVSPTVNSGPVIDGITCTENAAAKLSVKVRLPDRYTGGTLFCRLVVHDVDASGHVSGWDARAQCRTPGSDPINATWGTAVAMDVTMPAPAFVPYSNAEATITPNGSCVGGDMLFLELNMDTTANTDDNDAVIEGLTCEYLQGSRSD